MAEETWKADEHSKTPGGTVYKQVAPAGVAAEMTAEDPVPAETGAALGHWLTEVLGGNASLRRKSLPSAASRSPT